MYLLLYFVITVCLQFSPTLHYTKPIYCNKIHYCGTVFVESIHPVSWGSTTLWSSLQWKHSSMATVKTFPWWRRRLRRHSSKATVKTFLDGGGVFRDFVLKDGDFVLGGVFSGIMESSSDQNGSTSLSYQHPTDVWK